MNASQYIVQLQDELDPSGRFAQQVEPQTSMFAKSCGRSLNRLMTEERARLPDIGFGVLPTLEGNAWVLRTPTGGVALCIDTLLPSALWTVGRAVAEEFQQARQQSTPINAMEPARGIWLAAQWFLTRDSSFAQGLGVWKSGLTRLDDFVGTMFGGFVGLQLDFVVMHELQHVLAGHLGPTVEMSAGCEVADSQGSTLHHYVRSQRQEFEADRLAVAAMARDPQFVRVGAIAGCELLFLFLHVVEQLQPTTSAPRSHPLARERLEAVRRAHDAIAAPSPGYGARLRRILDHFFATDLEMFQDLPPSVWGNPDFWADARRAYLRAVVEDGMPTHVTFGGEMSAEVAAAALDLAEQWTGNRGLVHVGVVEERSSLDGGPAIVEGLVSAVAAVSSLCVELIQIRREGRSHNGWDAGTMAQLVVELLQGKGADVELLEVRDFDGTVETDGEICELVVRDRQFGRSYQLNLILHAASFSVYVSRYDSGAAAGPRINNARA